MSFLGKKFKRTSCENIEELAKVLNEPDKLLHLIKSNAVFSFNRVDDSTFKYDLISGGHTMSVTFRLGDPTDAARRDGGKVKITYSMEGDNVIKQVIEPSGDGAKTIYFRREFTDNSCVMTITVEGSDVEGKVHYEIVP